MRIRGRSSASSGPDEPLSTTARGGVRSLIFRVATAGSDFCVVLVTARGFGAEGRGVYALTSFSVTAVGMLLGGPSIVMRAEIGRKRVTLGRLFAASLALSGSALGLSLLATPVVASVATFPSIPFYVLIATPPMLLTELQISLYQALGDVRRMHYVWLARSVVPLTALSCVAVVEPGHTGLALLAWSCSQFIVPACTLWVENRQARLDFHELRPLFLRLVRRGMPVSVANGSGLVAYRLDIIVVASLLTIADVGRYSVAVAAGESLLLISRAAITGAYAPIISSELRESIRVTMRTIRHIIALLVPGGLLLTVASKIAMGPVFGPAFANVWVLVGLLVPSFVSLSITELLVSFLVVRLERTRELVIRAVGAVMVNIALAATLVTLIGLPGAAISSSVTYTLASLYLLVHFVRAGAPSSPRAYLPGAAELRDYARILAALREGRLRPSRGPA